MVPFAGYTLPVQYKEGVLTSHLHTRAADSASLFDVGHMGQIRWHGKDAVKFLETIVVGDLESLKQVRPRRAACRCGRGPMISFIVVCLIVWLCVCRLSSRVRRACLW